MIEKIHPALFLRELAIKKSGVSFRASHLYSKDTENALQILINSLIEIDAKEI